MDTDYHALPGPDQFLSRLEEDLAEGKSVVLKTPENLPILFACLLNDRLKNRVNWKTLYVVDESPLACIRRNLPVPDDADLSTPERLYQLPVFANYILQLENIPSGRLSDWTVFLCEFAHASRQRKEYERTAFFIHVTGDDYWDVPEDLLLVKRRWDDVIGEADALLLAHQLNRSGNSSSILTRIKVALCVELSQGDIELCRHLGSCALSELLNPLQLLAQFGLERRWDSIDLEGASSRRWRMGIEQTYCGSRQTHLAWQALRGNAKLVDLAVWRAELKVLFPFIEEKRHAFIQRCSNTKYLKVPHTRQYGEEIHNFEDLEWGDIKAQFDQRNAISPQLRNFVRAMWTIRCNLAHQTPLPPDLITPRVLDFDINNVG